MKLVQIKNNVALFRTDTGAIVAVPIDEQARKVLAWHQRNIPAND